MSKCRRLGSLRNSRIADINPTLDKSEISDELEVSFVPMPAVEELSGRINLGHSRRFAQVKKGYTPFREGDVLFAKITPCMENGKMAVVPALKNGYGFGSTEFHVLRPFSGIDAKYVYYFVSSQRFRSNAEHKMTGAVGQRRVPTAHLSDHVIPLPPSREQCRIVAKIEELFSELDKGVEALTLAREQLEAYRLAILKSAFDGQLTTDWRLENPTKLETADQRRSQLQQANVTRYQQILIDWNARDKTNRSAKPRPPAPIAAAFDTNTEPFPLPKGWSWVPLSWLLSTAKKPMATGPFGTMLKKHEHQTSGVPVLGIENIGKAVFVPGNKIFVSEEKSEDLLAFAVEAGDVVISRSGTVGEICEVPAGLGTALISTNLIRITLNPDVIIPAFFVYMFQGGGSVRTQVKELCKGSSREFLNQSILEAIKFPLCGLDEQKEVLTMLNEHMSHVEALTESIESEVNRAKILRQSILKQAFSGRLVAQDPTDEPASALVERVRAEREKTLSKRKERNSKNGKKNAA